MIALLLPIYRNNILGKKVELSIEEGKGSVWAYNKSLRANKKHGLQVAQMYKLDVF